jgi:hypothetical protein
MLPPTTNPTTRAFRRYNLEFAISMIAYVAFITISRNLLHGPLRDASTPVQIAVAISPILPVAMLFVSVIRFLHRTDEFLRRMIIESLAVAGGVTALLAVTYGLIESEPLFPRPSAWWTWAVFGTSWLASSLLHRWRHR